MAKNDLNSVFLIGNLVRDPESTISTKGTTYTKFSIANNNGFSNDPEKSVNYFEIIAWGKLAEICSKYLAKGKQVGISGRLDQSRWKDKENNTRSKISITANNVQFLGSNNSSSNPSSSSSGNQSDMYPDNNFAPSSETRKPMDEDISNINTDNDVPF